MSSRAWAVVVAVALLLPGVTSVVALETDAVLLSVVPLAVVALTLTISVNVAVAAGVIVAIVDWSVPVPPTGGVVEVQVAGAVNETNVVFAGMASLSVTVWALLGPRLLTVMV